MVSFNKSSLRTQGPQRERKALIAAARTLVSALVQRPFSPLRPGVMGPCVRRDDPLSLVLTHHPGMTKAAESC